MAEAYDVLIVGAGIAGLSAAMYAGRLKMKVLVVGELVGGAITLTRDVENYPGFDRIGGTELAERMRAHAEKFGAEIITDRVVGIRWAGKCFRAEMQSGKAVTAKSLILATGTEHRKLGVPGEEEFAGKGVSYCALCDGPFFKGKRVCVVGGSDSAAKEALLLAEWAEKVYVLARGERLRAEPVNLEKLMANKKIEVITRVQVREIRGDKVVEGVLLDRPVNGSEELPVDGVFVEIGRVPANELAKQLGVRLNEKDEIVIDRESRTSVEGVFAAGDACDTRFKQAATGAGEGVSAAYSAYQYVGAGKFACE